MQMQQRALGCRANPTYGPITRDELIWKARDDTPPWLYLEYYDYEKSETKCCEETFIMILVLPSAATALSKNIRGILVNMIN